MIFPRTSSLALLSDEIGYNDDDLTLHLNGLEKTSRPGKIKNMRKCSDTKTLFTGNKRLEIRCQDPHKNNPRLGLANILRTYQERTEPKRELFKEQFNQEHGRLFVANTRPHQPVLPTTLAR